MKKILYLHAGSEMYGADKVLLELIKGLDKSEFEPHVILPNDGILVEELKNIGVKVAVLDYPILRRKYFNPKGILEYIKNYAKFSKVLLTYVKKEEINLIHNNTTAVLEGIYLKNKAKIPLIWHVHEIIVRPKFITDFINFLLGCYATKIITVSEAVAKHIKKSKFVSEDKVNIIYNGVDNRVYYPYSDKEKLELKKENNISSDSLVVGMIGRVNSWKGQNDFLDATVPLLEENPNLVLMLVGGVFEGEEWRMRELKERISQLPCSERIIIKDFQKSTTKLYNLYDIFILPSTNPDPLPTVVLEAMACGKPILAYRHGGVCEMVEEDKNGLLSEPNIPKGLTNNISYLLQNKEKREEFGKHSIQRQRDYFSLESYISNFSNLYRDLLSDK
ncbi:glycosyltransferase family 4 protein [Streptococcus pneumoniae]